MEAYFSNFTNVIQVELQKAESEINIAVAWFTHDNLFQILINKIRQGVKVNLILNNDYINNRENGIDLQHFINIQGNLFFYENELMHHKFCVIDGKILFNGSFNWTYQANSSNKENLLKIEDLRIINDFSKEFEKLKLEAIEQKGMIALNQKSTNNTDEEFLTKEKEKQGIEIMNKMFNNIKNRNFWFVKPGTKAELWKDCIREGNHIFGFADVMKQLLATQKFTEKDIRMAIKQAEVSEKNFNAINNYINEVKIGDFFIAVDGVKKIVGIGIVKSNIKPYNKTNLSDYISMREVNWTRIDLNKNAIDILEKGRKQFGQHTILKLSEAQKNNFLGLKN